MMRVRKIAILIDGGFFLKRLKHICTASEYETACAVANTTYKMCKKHVQSLIHEPKNRKPSLWLDHVYRIFYYDAHPYDGTAHNPVSNLQIQYKNSEEAQFRNNLFSEIRKKRKFALRLGKVIPGDGWHIKEEALRKKILRTKQFVDILEAAISQFENDSLPQVLSEERIKQLRPIVASWKDLTEDSVHLALRQKGVDMKIGIDISTLTLKKQVDTIILVTGDSDFVPAAKVARREGVEFLLDPMHQEINDDLNEHIDGIVSGFPPRYANGDSEFNED